MHRFFLVLLLALTGLALPACWYAGRTNGASNNLYFRGPSATTGVKLPFSVEVTRYPEQWQNICTQPASYRPSGEVRPQGGDPCFGGSGAPLAITPITLVAASCDDGACSVEDGSVNAATPGDVVVVVTPLRAGTITLHTKVRAQDGSGSWDDAYDATATTVARIGFTRADRSDAPTSFAVLPGAPVSWSPVALGGDGARLAADADDFAVTWDQGAVGPAADGQVRALHAGTGTVTLRAAGMVQEEVLQVVDPATVVGMEARLAATTVGMVGDGDDVSQGGALAEIVLGSLGEGSAHLVLVLTTADGTRALGGASSVAVSGNSDDVYAVAPTAVYGWTFWLNDLDVYPSVPWTLTAKLGSAQLTLPVRRADEGDAGGAAGDAGDADAARSEAGDADAGSSEAGDADAQLDAFGGDGF